MTELAFLPHLRRGLARQLTSPDPTSGGLDAATIALGLTVAGAPVGRDASLLAPHRVAALAADEIVRRYPTPGAREVETTTFPLAEFRAPDLPWRYTPAAAGSHGRLRPWVALAVVEQNADGIAYTTLGAAGRLTIAPDQLHQLPPAAELWGWAHVQSADAADAIVSTAAAAPDALLSRIVCPRRLTPGTSYRAALVGTFTAGADERSEPAWEDDGTETVELLVYDSWTFTTAAEGGDFEALCDRLEPATEVATVGVRRVDVSACGLDVAWPHTPMLIDLAGALADPSVATNRRPPGTNAFAATAVPILDSVLARAADTPGKPADYDPLTDDPVVGLPFYASWPAAVQSVPGAGWPRELNVWPDRRIAAGLGAEVVRRDQEALMAAAWDQLGSVREAADELNRGRLAAETGRSWHPRVAAVAAGDRIALTAPLLTFASVAGTPARRVIREGAAPTTLLDRVWLRRTPRAWGAAASTAYVQATRTGATPRQLQALDFQRIETPQGITGLEAQLAVGDDPADVLGSDQFDYVKRTGLDVLVGGDALATYVRHGRRPSPPPLPRPPPHPPPAAATADDVAAAAAALDPLAATRAALIARIPALATLLPEGDLPPGLSLAPVFGDALFWDLRALDADMIVPGLGTFPANRVRLLSVNPSFIGAFLAGANQQLASEFVWREYPADLTATFFSRFFDHANPQTVDIAPIAGWPAGSSIADNAAAAAGDTAILIRGDLVDRYPDVSVTLAPPGGHGQPDVGAAVAPSFEGRVGSDALIVGFPVPTDEVLGKTGPGEHFVVLAERTVAPRFGLDLTRSGPLETWSELSWIDFSDPDHARIGELATRTIDGVTWGRNAAHQAAATFQQPYRRLFPATRLVVI